MAERKYGRGAVNTPSNWISAARLIGGGLLDYHTWKVKGKSSVAGATAFALTEGSDLLDGRLARQDGTTTVGEIIDPIADITTVVGQMAALAAHDKYSKVLLGLIVAREADIKLKRHSLSKKGLSLPASSLSKIKNAAQSVDVFVRRLPQTSEKKSVTRTTAAISGALTGLSWIDLRLKARQLEKEYTTADVAFPIYWDCDGVLVGKHHKFNILGRATKALPKTMKNLTESLEAFGQSGDFANVLVATSRDELLRGRQTSRQLKSTRHGNIFDSVGGNVLYSDHSYTKKVQDILTRAIANYRGDQLQKAVLIDDSDKKIIKALINLAEDPKYKALLNHFIYVNFGHTSAEGYVRTIEVVQKADMENKVKVHRSKDVVILQAGDSVIPIVSMPAHGQTQAQDVMETIRNLPFPTLV